MGQRARSPHSNRVLCSVRVRNGACRGEFGLFLILPQLWRLTLTQDDSPWRGSRLGGGTDGEEDRWGSDVEKESVGPSSPPSRSPVPAEMIRKWEELGGGG